MYGMTPSRCKLKYALSFSKVSCIILTLIQFRASERN